MSFYVPRWPGPCEDRDGIMGHVNLNGIQTPPSRLYFEERGPGTPVSNWTYDGPLAELQPMPELACTLFTQPCEGRFVRWRGVRLFFLGETFSIILVDVRKKDRSGFQIDTWDTYWVELTLNGLTSDEEVEHRQLSGTDYSRYQNNTPGLEWKWSDDEGVFQTVSWTEFWPMAFDRILPGPPYVPDL